MAKTEAGGEGEGEGEGREDKLGLLFLLLRAFLPRARPFKIFTNECLGHVGILSLDKVL